MIPGVVVHRAVLCADGQQRHDHSSVFVREPSNLLRCADERGCGPHRLAEQTVTVGPWVPVDTEERS